MTYEIKTLSRGKNFSGCVTFKGYRKTQKQCVTAVHNYISSLTDKSIYEVRVTISSFGNKIDGCEKQAMYRLEENPPVKARKSYW